MKPANAQQYPEPPARRPNERLNPFIDAVAEMLVARALKDPRVAAIRRRLDGDRRAG